MYTATSFYLSTLIQIYLQTIYIYFAIKLIEWKNSEDSQNWTRPIGCKKKFF